MTQTAQDVTAGADDPLDTALITRLANEFFSESTRGPSLPAGFRPPPGTPNGPELSGGYPSANPTTHPPVHSGLQPLPPSPATPGTPSGEQAPGSEDTYPFGEPRCNGNGSASATKPRHVSEHPHSRPPSPALARRSSPRIIISCAMPTRPPSHLSRARLFPASARPCPFWILKPSAGTSPRCINRSMASHSSGWTTPPPHKNHRA